MTPAAEPSGLWELPKGLVRGYYGLKGMIPGYQEMIQSQRMEAPTSALATFDKIDAGDIKSVKDINSFISPRKLPTDMSAEEILKGKTNVGAELNAIGLAKDYLKASPAERKAIRGRAQADIQEATQKFGEAAATAEQYKKEAEPYAPRVKSFTDIEGLGDASSYFASKLGEAIPQFAPVLASGILTRGRGIVPTSVGMELPNATQARVDFITKKLENEPDPAKRTAEIAKYVRDSHDVTFSSAVVSGLFDALLGPEAGLAKAMVSGELRNQTRAEILKALPKVAAKSGAEEFLTGGLQETVMINAERILGEQGGDAFTKENIIRVVDSALSEAIGGLGMSGAIQGGRAYFAKPSTAETQTPEGAAIRGLDTLAEEEEAAAETQPAARTLESLTEQEVDAIQRQLYAELGRPATEQELLGAFNDYISDQNAGVGTQPGTTGAGVSDTGVPEAAGVPSAGAATTPTEGGLAGAGVSTQPAGEGAVTEPGALKEQRDVAT
jgi:hypothetical protein